MKVFKFKPEIINEFNTIEIGERKFPVNNSFDSIVIVGSSGSGKTTLINQLRKFEKLVIPQRLITRQPRKNDNIAENKYISEDKLLNLYKNQELLFYWTRKMENNREEKYGIVNIDIHSDAIPVISGNNALFNNSSSISPLNILDKALFIGIYTPDKIRYSRLKNRSPDLFENNPTEIAYRLGDSSNNIIKYSHIIVNNYGKKETLALHEFCKFILNIIKYD